MIWSMAARHVCHKYVCIHMMCMMAARHVCDKYVCIHMIYDVCIHMNSMISSMAARHVCDKYVCIHMMCMYVKYMYICGNAYIYIDVHVCALMRTESACGNQCRYVRRLTWYVCMYIHGNVNEFGYARALTWYVCIYVCMYMHTPIDATTSEL
jgi:hypothetical protein